MEEDHPWDQFLNTYKLPLIMGVVGVVLLIAGIISSGIIPNTFIKTAAAPAVKAASTVSVSESQLIKVDVGGAVKNKGVYSLPVGSRIEDALKMAGGVTEEADPTYLSKTINLAQKIADGMKIYIPKINETPPSSIINSEAGNSAKVATTGPININTASLSELDQLSGVGAVTAQKIVDGRPYQNIEELVIKKVIGRAAYDKIKDKVSTF